MKKPFAIPVIKALPAIDTAEPRIAPWLIFLVRFACRPYLAGFVGNARIYPDENAAGIIIPAMERALSRKSRCILAFRHQNGWEPQILMWFTLYRLAKFAGKRGFRFPLPPRLLFVHGYELFRWGGPLLRFALPRFGAMPIHHAKLDSAGLDRIYRSLREGPYPLAIAPEGQVSYTLAEEPRIESGTVRIALTVAEQLLACAGKDGTQTARENCPAVEIIPVSLYPEYGRKALIAAERLLRRVECVCGIQERFPPPDPNAFDLSRLDLSRLDLSHLMERFLRCREIILALNEKRYGLDREDAVRNRQDFGARLDAVIEAALQSASAILRIDRPPGDTINRLYVIRQICWDRIFPENTGLASLPALERAFLDLRAGEAWYAARHMELADFSFYFHRPPGESPASIVEYAQNLYDFANRTMGGIFGTRKKIAPDAIRISAAPPINITEMMSTAAGAEGLTREHRKAINAEANELLKQRLSAGLT
ncbi:MAG: 1-acyl-sn-glycerol-3-phosphate acyltransferase [Treponema sp.]|jgi:1-acyl-sn-glycerol-3-phosphate acyltransferase|nr:1-acyl-sn-glycerol-3-phosphate acyltransferase [Treponema sp.]